MITLAVLALSVVVGSFVGYFYHRLIHFKWTGPLHEGHMEHHLVMYPPSRLTSETYEIRKWYNSGPILFTPAALVLVGLAAVACWFLGISMWTFIAFGVGLIGFGFLNDYVHDSFHLREHWLQKFPYYRKLRRLHFKHHVDMAKNYGIVALQWDDVFKTKSE